MNYSYIINHPNHDNKFICNICSENIPSNQIIGLKIQVIKRRSKYLLFFFNKDIVMLVHLGMTGKFFVVNKKNEKSRVRHTKRGTISGHTISKINSNLLETFGHTQKHNKAT